MAGDRDHVSSYGLVAGDGRESKMTMRATAEKRGVKYGHGI